MRSVESGEGGVERCLEALDGVMEAAVRWIAVGEEGWMERFESVVSDMIPCRGLGRRMVVMALIGHLEREAKRKGIDGGDGGVCPTKLMYDKLEEMERRYEVEKELEGVVVVRGHGGLLAAMMRVLTSLLRGILIWFQ